VARVRPGFDGKHRLHFVSLINSGVLSSFGYLADFRTCFETRGKNECSCRNRFARDARQRRVDVARRRRGWRSIAHTVSPCGSANRRCVWSTDAAHLASIVCRQPPKKSSQDRSKLLWTRRVPQKVPFRSGSPRSENMSSSVGALAATSRRAAMQWAALPGRPPRASQHSVGRCVGARSGCRSSHTRATDVSAPAQGAAAATPAPQMCRRQLRSDQILLSVPNTRGSTNAAVEPNIPNSTAVAKQRWCGFVHEGKRLACAMSDRLRTAIGGVDQRRRTAATGQANDDLRAAGMRKGAAGSGRGDAGWGRRKWGRREKRRLRAAGVNQACAALRPGGGSKWSSLSTPHAITQA